jgi:hypothetical protein
MPAMMIPTLHLYRCSLILISLLTILPAHISAHGNLHATDIPYCIVFADPEQHVITGIKKVIFPFTVINYDESFDKHLNVKIEPADARVSIHPIETKSSIADGDIGIARYEMWVEGVSNDNSDSVVIHSVSLNIPSCAQAIDACRIFTYPIGRGAASIQYMLDRLKVGMSPMIDVTPLISSNIPLNSIAIRTIFNQLDTVTSIGSRQKCSCISADIRTLDVDANWRYRPKGTDYREDLNIFSYSVSRDQMRFAAPQVDFENRAESWDTKNLKLVTAGIVIAPPRIDCYLNGQDSDISTEVFVDRYTLGKFVVKKPTLSLNGSSEYRLVIQLVPDYGALKELLKSAKRSSEMKFAGDCLEAKIRSGVVKHPESEQSDAIRSDYISNFMQVCIPEFRYSLDRYIGARPLWSHEIRWYHDDYKGSIRAYSVDGQTFSELKKRTTRTGVKPAIPLESIDSVRKTSSRLYDRIRRYSGSRDEVIDRLLKIDPEELGLTDHAYIRNIHTRNVIEHCVAMRQFAAYNKEPFANNERGILVIRASSSPKHSPILCLIGFDTSNYNNLSEELFYATPKQYNHSSDLEDLKYYNQDGAEAGNVLDYLESLLKAGKLKEVTSLCTD